MYKVGQVLFVIDSQKNAVLPCRVVEELTKKTLEGDKVTYKVIFGIDPKNTMDLSAVKGEIYTKLSDVRKALTENVTKWVETHIQKAAKASAVWYKYDAILENPLAESEQEQLIQTLPEMNMDEPQEPKQESEGVLIEIAPGKFAKARLRGP